MADELIDAVRASIGLEPTAAASTETPDTTVTTPPSGEVDQGAVDAVDAALGADDQKPAADGEPDTSIVDDAQNEPSGDATPRKRDAATGKFVKADGTEDPDQKARVGEVGADGKPVAKPAAEAKKADPINDPIPADLKPKTAERIQTLVTTAKELTTRAEQAEQDRQLLVDQVSSTGATPQQYVETLNILRDINSGDAGAEQRAYEYLTQVVANLGTRLGKAPVGADPLTGHQDLIQDVINGKVTRERAEELANARRGQKAQETRQQQAQQVQQGTQQQAQAIKDGTTALNALETKLKGENGVEFAAKRAAVVKAARPVLAKLHPSQWADTFEALYRNIPAPQAARVAAPAGAPPARQPMRGKPAAGQQKAAPKSNEDAIRMALGL